MELYKQYRTIGGDSIEIHGGKIESSDLLPGDKLFMNVVGLLLEYTVERVDSDDDRVEGRTAVYTSPTEKIAVGRYPINKKTISGETVEAEPSDNILFDGNEDYTLQDQTADNHEASFEQTNWPHALEFGELAMRLKKHGVEPNIQALHESLSGVTLDPGTAPRVVRRKKLN